MFFRSHPHGPTEAGARGNLWPVPDDRNRGSDAHCFHIAVCAISAQRSHTTGCLQLRGSGPQVRLRSIFGSVLGLRLLHWRIAEHTCGHEQRDLFLKE